MPRVIAALWLLLAGTGIALFAKFTAASIAVAYAQGAALPSQHAAPMPNIVVPSTYRNVATAQRRPSGGFIFDTQVNGVTLPMLFDTGASVVGLRAEDAGQLGFDVEGLHFTGRASTANGVAEVAPVMLNRLTVGDITRYQVLAFVAKPGSLKFNLLGQSFLSRLAGYRLNGDQLVLQGGQ